MKLPKSLLALLLGLVLVFTLGLPAFAEGEAEEPNPAMPVITVQPQGGRVRVGEAFTLSVQAHIPNDDEIEFRWCIDGWEMDAQNAERFTLVGDYAGTYAYSVEVINKDNPACRVTSGTALVEVYLTSGDKFKADLIEFGNTALGVLLLPFAPFAFLLWWIILPALSNPIVFIRNLFQ